ncbi:hypothetical protein P280DRAFT_521788 [Massarina eburnea CBS 473.64]|uniref:Uncharacterized protein n=1 Tax=Massarina eburnea CBS 473.64 TaxID=1395130 RepID=A0A6A6RND2_9PLEO|nr:hypothetical protein P280DRAFT_521788 [Massarina eburnea CBS 473.64]
MALVFNAAKSSIFAALLRLAGDMADMHAAAKTLVVLSNEDSESLGFDVEMIGFHENEYKFFDKTDKQAFNNVDGNPSAAQALFGQLTGRHTIREDNIVCMRWEGVIDEEIGASKGTRMIVLSEILKPLKLWETVDMSKVPKELTIEFRKQIVDFAIIYNAPHLLKGHYKIRDERPPTVRWSWAKMVVILFVGKSDLLKAFTEAGLMTAEDFEGWYDRALGEFVDNVKRSATEELLIDALKNGDIQDLLHEQRKQ